MLEGMFFSGLRIIDQKLRTGRLLACSPGLENTKRHTSSLNPSSKRHVRQASRTTPKQTSRTTVISKLTTHVPLTKQISRKYATLPQPIKLELYVLSTPALLQRSPYTHTQYMLHPCRYDSWASGVDVLELRVSISAGGLAGRFDVRSVHPSATGKSKRGRLTRGDYSAGCGCTKSFAQHRGLVATVLTSALLLGGVVSVSPGCLLSSLR